MTETGKGTGKREKGKGAVAGAASPAPFSLFPVPGSLVVQTAFLGDVILTTGLLAELASREGPVDVLVTPNAGPLVETHPAVRTVLVYDKRGRDRGLAAFRRLAGQLERRRYARVYLPHR